jgi:membrane protein implicated in regulation of membrane protease activity
MKEVAKFFAGLCAWEAIVHLAFAVSGLLPITWFGITLTPMINTVQIIVPAIVSALLAYYAWGGRRRSAGRKG